MFLFQYCMRLPAMILYIAYLMHVPTGHDSIIIAFLYLFFWRSSYQKLPHFYEFTPAQKYQNDFFLLF